MSEAPEYLILARRLGDDRRVQMLPGETMSFGFIDSAKYVRADIADDMLEVLKWVESTKMCEHGGGGEMIRAAIAKAEGGEG